MTFFMIMLTPSYIPANSKVPFSNDFKWSIIALLSNKKKVSYDITPPLRSQTPQLRSQGESSHIMSDHLRSGLVHTKLATRVGITRLYLRHVLRQLWNPAFIIPTYSTCPKNPSILPARYARSPYTWIPYQHMKFPVLRWIMAVMFMRAITYNDQYHVPGTRYVG